IGEALGARLCASPEVGVEGVLGNVDAQYSVSHFKVFPPDPRSDGSASINLVHGICARTRPRIPSGLNSGAWKSGAKSTARPRSPKGRRRLTAFLAVRVNEAFARIALPGCQEVEIACLNPSGDAPINILCFFRALSMVLRRPPL